MIKIYFKLLEYSLNSASREQGLKELKYKLLDIIPDLSEQYTSFKIEGDYIVNKLCYLWRKIDFDGFYGVILERDSSILKRYQDC